MAVCDHLVKGIPVLEGCAADSFICIDLNQCPVGMTIHEILVVDLLQLIGSGLADIIGRNTNIDGHTLGDIIIVVIDGFLRRYELVIIGIDFDPHPSADPFLCLVPFLPFLLINHVITCPFLHLPEGPSNRGRA